MKTVLTVSSYHRTFEGYESSKISDPYFYTSLEQICLKYGVNYHSIKGKPLPHDLELNTPELINVKKHIIVSRLKKYENDSNTPKS